MQKHFFHILALFLLFFLLVFSAFFFWENHAVDETDVLKRNMATIVFRQATVTAEVADTESLRIRGLSVHAPLSPDAGMWFDFGSTKYAGMWMKEMSFPIDILWFNEELRAVYIKENVLPESYPEVFSPTVPSRYVLEVPAGFVKEKGVSLGDRISVQEHSGYIYEI